jgi:hypothetical protein
VHTPAAVMLGAAAQGAHAHSGVQRGSNGIGCRMKGTRGGVLSVRHWRGKLDRVGVKHCGHVARTGMPAHAA